MDVDEPLASRPARVAIGAFAGGTIGVVSCALVIEWLDPGLPDMTMEMLTGMNMGGGLGWIAGAATGWLGGRNRPSPPWITRVVLLADRTFVSLEVAQAALDAWVADYNTVRPHQARNGLRGDVGLDRTRAALR